METENREQRIRKEKQEFYSWCERHDLPSYMGAVLRFYLKEGRYYANN